MGKKELSLLLARREDMFGHVGGAGMACLCPGSSAACVLMGMLQSGLSKSYPFSC